MPMKIVHVASELFPYIKTGGLADAVGSLCSTLADKGHEVSVFVPGYRALLEHKDAATAERILRVRIELGDAIMSGDIRVFSPKVNLRVFAVCREEYFDRKNPYGNGERDYEDNHHRFIFFCKAVVETLRLTNHRADIVHAHDWQAALMPVLLRHSERIHNVNLAQRTFFTIHNIAFQGVFPLRTFYRTNLPNDLSGIDGLEYYGQLSFMKAGILFADRVTTVSPRYAKEIQTAEFGCGLEGVVQTRVEDLAGLINGIDPAVWNPVSDEHLPARYSPGNMAGKAICRSALLKAVGLPPVSEGVPVFGMVCRLTEQKGVQLVLACRPYFAAKDCRLVILGTGDRKLEASIRDWASAEPGKVALVAKLDEAMSHLVEAGSDFFLMPSLFEPCGLNQMYSQAYGTIPIVSRVGGLVDTVIDIDADPGHGTGIIVAPSAAGLQAGIERAFRLFANRHEYSHVQARGMTRDFSWAKAAQAYLKLYDESL